MIVNKTCNLWSIPRYLILISVLFFYQNQALCQKKLVNRVILSWDFFKNDKPKDAIGDALVFGGISLGFKPLGTSSNVIKIIPNINVHLSAEKSFLDFSKKYIDTSLLQHQQGLIDIAVIYASKLQDTIRKTVFYKSNFEIKIKGLHSFITEKMLAEQKRYSIETNNGANLPIQRKWNLYFTELFKL